MRDRKTFGRPRPESSESPVPWTVPKAIPGLDERTALAESHTSRCGNRARKLPPGAWPLHAEALYPRWFAPVSFALRETSAARGAWT